MVEKIEETVHDIKTPGLNNPEAYMLRHNRFDTYLVLIFSDLNKAQINKLPYRDSPHHEIEILMSFNFLNFYEPNEHIEDYHFRKPIDESFFEVGDKKYIYVGKNIYF